MQKSKREKHGMSNSRLYRIWKNMKGRCTNPKKPDYYLYGGRGISFFDEWVDFIPFMTWSLSNGYSENLCLDRIDNNGNYCPENCRWTTALEQAHNKRSKNKKSGVDGVSQYPNGKWKAKICQGRACSYLGTFDTFEDAVKARKDAENRFWNNGEPFEVKTWEVSSRNTSGKKGVTWDNWTNRWQARISVKIDGKYRNIYLGRFDTVEEAITARLNGELKYLGTS